MSASVCALQSVHCSLILSLTLEASAEKGLLSSFTSRLNGESLLHLFVNHAKKVHVSL